jgi:hypothetical protein
MHRVSPYFREGSTKLQTYLVENRRGYVFFDFKHSLFNVGPSIGRSTTSNAFYNVVRITKNNIVHVIETIRGVRGQSKRAKTLQKDMHRRQR